MTSLAKMELKQIKAITRHLNNHIDETLQKIQPEGDRLIDQLPLEQDMVRQTYVVGRGDVVKQEVQSLVGSGTVKATTMDQVTSSTADGRQVEIIPVKLICTRKAPNGRRKARIVARGNYSQAVSSSNTSTGGIDVISLRTLLAAGSQRVFDWKP